MNAHGVGDRARRGPPDHVLAARRLEPRRLSRRGRCRRWRGRAGVDPRVHRRRGGAAGCSASLPAPLGSAKRDVDAEGEPGFRLPSRDVILLGVLCFLDDHRGRDGRLGRVYLRGDLGTTAGVAASGFAAFAAG